MEFFLMRHHSRCISLLDPSGNLTGMFDTVGESGHRGLSNEDVCIP